MYNMYLSNKLSSLYPSPQNGIDSISGGVVIFGLLVMAVLYLIRERTRRYSYIKKILGFRREKIDNESNEPYCCHAGTAAKAKLMQMSCGASSASRELSYDDWWRECMANEEAVKWYSKRKKQALEAYHSDEEHRKSKEFRRKLIGYCTIYTYPFYSTLPYTPFSLLRHIDSISRERYAYTPKATPEHYWECEMSDPDLNEYREPWFGPKPKVFRRLWSKCPEKVRTGKDGSHLEPSNSDENVQTDSEVDHSHRFSSTAKGFSEITASAVENKLQLTPACPDESPRTRLGVSRTLSNSSYDSDIIPPTPPSSFPLRGRIKLCSIVLPKK